MEQTQVAPVIQVKTSFQKSKSLWQHAFDQIMADRLAVLSVLIFLTYCVLALLSATGIIANEWSREIGPSYAAPGGDFIFGTDIFGRSVFDKVIKGTEVAMSVGLVSAVISGIIGVSLGAVAGYFGGKIDEFIVWFYTTF
jgi:peptide/nickel transport system permease protein